MSLLPHLAPSLSSSHDRRSINRPRVHRRPYCAIYTSRVWSWWHDRMSVLWTNSTNMQHIRGMNMKICSRKRYMESKSFYNTISFRNLSVIREWQQKQCDVFSLKSYEVRLCLLNCIKEGVFFNFCIVFSRRYKRIDRADIISSYWIEVVRKNRSLWIFFENE